MKSGKMRIILFWSIYSQIFATIHTYKQFRLGRSNWGNLGAPGGSEGIVPPPAKWFVQKLDHFSPTDQRTWKQRYFVNDQFYNNKTNNGPIFLMIGGEGPADPRWMVKGAWIEYAEYINAMCILVEHRYYGSSHPVPDLSVKNLQYLNSRQALADLANFIGQMQEYYHLKSDTKWITFGGSYSGSLAAWMRLKYPHLVYAAISSSGPLEAEMDFVEYYKVVVRSLNAKSGSEDCVDTLERAHAQLAQLLTTEPDVIESTFKLCKPLGGASDLDVKTLFSNIADAFAELVQYNEDNRISVDERRRNFTISTVCELLTGAGDDAFELRRLARVTGLLLNSDGQCLDYSYDGLVRDLRATEWTQHAERQWFYQTCTEFGFYQTSGGAAKVFGNDFDLKYYVHQCRDVFGPKFDSEFIEGAVRDTNNYYGGTDIAASRILSVQGSIDPWHVLGLTSQRVPSLPVIYIEGTAHCADMYPSADADLRVLREARSSIRNQLIRWL